MQSRRISATDYNSATGLGCLSLFLRRTCALRIRLRSSQLSHHSAFTVTVHFTVKPMLAERLRIGGGNEWRSGLQVDHSGTAVGRPKWDFLHSVSDAHCASTCIRSISSCD